MSATGDQDYDVIEASGQTIYIGSGQTFENKLIDVSNGAGFTIYARGASNWTIRNVGVRGYYEGGGFAISATDGSASGQSLVENVYLADGASKSGASFVHGPGAIFIGPSNQHNGHITFRQCNVQGFPNNGFYASNGPGSVSFENCMAINNGVSNFRCTQDGRLDNCVAYNDTTDYGWYHSQNDYVEENGRPLWVWPKGSGSAEVYNTHMTNGPYPATVFARGSASVEYVSGGLSGGTQGSVSVGSQVSSSPDLSPPAGVPLTPEQAASGGGSNSGGGGPQPGDDEDTDWSSPTPPADPDRSSVMTGVAFHHTDDYDEIEIRNCDFIWHGDGRVARTRDDGYGQFRNCRFGGDEPEVDQ